MFLNNPESRHSKKGELVGRRIGGNLILRVLFYPFARIFHHFAIKWFKQFRNTYPAEKLVAFIVYSERHQYEYFFGESGTLHDYSWNVLHVDYRKELLNQWIVKQDWIITKILQRLDISLKKLPFGIVFTSTGIPMIYHMSKAYRQRRRDKGLQIEMLLKSFSKKIDLHIKAINERHAACDSIDTHSS